MPIYEYECRACGKHTDIRHGFDDTNTEACPACDGQLARVFSAGGIVFKGSGFYINDSKKSGGGGSSGSDSSSSSPSSSPPSSSPTSGGSDATAA